MASTQTASRLWKSHPTESTVSQAGRQATLFLSTSHPPLVFIPQSPLTSSHLQCNTLVWYTWNICLVPLKMIRRVKANLSFQRVVMVKPFWGHETSVITVHSLALRRYSNTWWESIVKEYLCFNLGYSDSLTTLRVEFRDWLIRFSGPVPVINHIYHIVTIPTYHFEMLVCIAVFYNIIFLP